MKVTLISPYALSVFGGVQEQVLSMSRELESRGHRVLIVTPDSGDTTTYDTPAEIVRLGSLVTLPANGSRAPLSLAGSASRAALAAIRSFGPDVVHFHEPFAPRIGYAALRAHVAPAVGTFHRSGEGPAVSMTRPLLRRLARHLDVGASVSPAAAATAKAACGLDTEVLFNGFEVARFEVYPREVPVSTRVITVGRLEDRKGVAVAIDAVTAHNENCPPEQQWHLDVVGDGPQRAALEDRARGQLVTFHGAVSDERKRQLLRQSSVAVCPALFGESFGLVLLEAMASQLPVAASDIPGYAAAAAEHAELFAPNDAHACAEAIARALTLNEDRLAAARQHARTWSMAALVDRYEAIYERAQLSFNAR